MPQANNYNPVRFRYLTGDKEKHREGEMVHRNYMVDLTTKTVQK